MQNVFAGLRNPSAPVQPEMMFTFLDELDIQDPLQPAKRRALQMLDVQPGLRVLDVGCGVGQEAQRLARQVGPEGYVAGIDQSETLIEEARRRAMAADLPIDFRVGDAHTFDFADGSFDRCRVERVLLYVRDPQRVVGEMARVLRPGGRMVALDFDMGGLVVDSPDLALGRRMLTLIDEAVPDGWAGRRLPRWFAECGLADIDVVPALIRAPLTTFRLAFEALLRETAAAGKADLAEVEAWWESLAAADRDGRFFSLFLGFVVGGRKPGGESAET